MDNPQKAYELESASNIIIVISRIIKVEVGVIGVTQRLRLIILTETTYADVKFTTVSTKVVSQKCKRARDNAEWHYG